MWSDAGDVELQGLKGREAFEAIHSSVLRHVEAGHRLIGLGGDHSVSYPAILADTEVYDDLNVLHFDVHPDTYDDFDNTPYSHASPFARLMETGNIKRLIQLGIRAQTRHVEEQAERFGIEALKLCEHSEIPDLVFDGRSILRSTLTRLTRLSRPVYRIMNQAVSLRVRSSQRFTDSGAR